MLAFVIILAMYNNMESQLEGFLEKRSSSVFSLKKWYKRFFVIDSQELYYTNPVKPYKPAKRFKLSSVIQVIPGGKHFFEFEILFRDRMLRLRTQTRFEKIQWMSQIRPKTRFSVRFPIPLKKNSIRLEDYVESIKQSSSTSRLTV